MGVLDSSIKSWHCCPLNRFNRSGVSRVSNFDRWWIDAKKTSTDFDDSTLTACDVLVVIKNWGAKIQSFEPVLPKLPTKPSWRLETLPCFDNFSHSNFIYFGFSHLDSPLLMIFPYIPLKTEPPWLAGAVRPLLPSLRASGQGRRKLPGFRGGEPWWFIATPPKKGCRKKFKIQSYNANIVESRATWCTYFSAAFWGGVSYDCFVSMPRI
jgi:hypothetical protein